MVEQDSFRIRTSKPPLRSICIDQDFASDRRAGRVLQMSQHGDLPSEPPRHIRREQDIIIAMKTLLSPALIAVVAALAIADVTLYHRASRAEAALSAATKPMPTPPVAPMPPTARTASSAPAAPPPSGRYLERLLHGEMPRPSANPLSGSDGRLFADQPNLRRLLEETKN